MSQIPKQFIRVSVIEGQDLPIRNADGKNSPSILMHYFDSLGLGDSYCVVGLIKTKHLHDVLQTLYGTFGSSRMIEDQVILSILGDVRLDVHAALIRRCSKRLSILCFILLVSALEGSPRNCRKIA